MVPGIALILSLFLIQGSFQLLIWLYWFQVKEYRFDRFFVFLKGPDGVRELLLIPISLKFLIFLISFNIYIPLFLYLVEILVLAAYFTLLFLSKKLRKPVFTKRMIRIVVITLFLLILTTPTYLTDLWLYLFISEAILLLGPIAGILVTDFSVKNTLEYEKSLASEKLKKFAPTIIAVTGSYGKTTTKDFITQMLSSKYKVLSTYKNQNTHFGIVRRIISDLEKDHKFFIVEIGAYKRGEIKQIANLLKPDVAVITGLEPQHLELFGSFENLKKAKFELVESLRDNGSVFFNVSNPEVGLLKSQAEKLGRGIKSYTYSINNKNEVDAFSQIKIMNSEGIIFSINYKGKSKEIKTNLISKRLIENLTGAILIAKKFDIEWLEILDISKKLELPEGTLNVFKTESGLTVIDDSYNSSPHGFEAALELLSQIKGERKIVATTGIIELGNQSYEIHKSLGKLMGNICDDIVLRNKEFLTALKDGLKGKSKITLITDPKRMIEFIDKNTNADSVLLIEGKLPYVVDYFRKT